MSLEKISFFNTNNENITPVVFNQKNNNQINIVNSDTLTIKKGDQEIGNVQQGETLFVTSNKDVQFLYGYNNTMVIDVTNTVKSLISNGSLFFRSSMTALFGDPFPYIQKYLYIKNGETLTSIKENQNFVALFVEQEEFTPIVEKQFTRQSIFQRIQERNRIRNL